MSASYRNDPLSSPNSNDSNTAPKAETPIAVDGFQQVLEMLQIADPAFRESLLRRLAARDRELARSLRESLGI
jgi:hypothetical protein